MTAGKNRSLAPASRRIHSARRGERGAVVVMVAGLLMAGGILAFCILAIDGPIMMTTKTQLQNAADAAALAGASIMDNSEDAARERARVFAEANYAVQDTLRPVIIDPDVDVTFPEVDGVKRIRVTTHRTEATGDPLRTYFLRVPFLSNTNTADVKAVAAAEMIDICSVQCVKPWAIPDRWDDANGDGFFTYGEPFTDMNGNGLYDSGEPYTDENGNGFRDPDEFYDPIITGYLAPGDVGTDLTMHSTQSPGEIAPGHYFSINLPPLGDPDQAPLTGGDWYREFIATCAPFYVAPGDSVQLEPGKMVGPTIQGIRDLIAQDPDAYWDPVTKTVEGSAFGLSPRIALVPFFDPLFPPVQGRNYVKITKIGAFFMESVGPQSQVNARFIKVSAPGKPCDPPSTGSFLVGIHLVE
jgi:Flp pilus assembly protein TadG